MRVEQVRRPAIPGNDSDSVRAEQVRRPAIPGNDSDSVRVGQVRRPAIPGNDSDSVRVEQVRGQEKGARSQRAASECNGRVFWFIDVKTKISLGASDFIL